MKARSREINIFNMSLLDILCGALGAFCFLSLTLFPFYGKVSNDSGGATLQQLQELQRKLDEALKRAAAGDDSALLENLRQQLKQFQEQLERETAARQQAEQNYQQAQQNYQQSEQHLQEAKQQNQKNEQRLQSINPVAVEIRWGDSDQDVDLFIKMPMNNQKGPDPLPDKKQSPYANGDSATDCKGSPCAEMWMMRDMPPGLTAEIYYKLMDLHNSPNGANWIYGNCLSSTGQFINLPPVKLDASKRLVMVGKLTIQQDHSLKFDAAVPDPRATPPQGSPKADNPPPPKKK